MSPGPPSFSVHNHITQSYEYQGMLSDSIERGTGPVGARNANDIFSIGTAGSEDLGDYGRYV